MTNSKTFQLHDENWRINHIKQFKGRGVLVIRNPYKAILSYWNFKTTRSHTKTIQSETLHSDRFIKFAKVGIERWLQVIEDWMTHAEDCYVIFYEVFRIFSSKIEYTF